MDITEQKSLFVFGIDKINIQNNKFNQTCCHITQDINIGLLDENVYIELMAHYNCGNNASVEFYIIDGNNEIPILPKSDVLVNNEKIFFGQSTRFLIDYEYYAAPIIKKDGEVDQTLTLQNAIKDPIGKYTIQYKPLNAYQYKPSSSLLKVKTILRVYNDYDAIPYVDNIKIMKYGRGTLWTENI